MNETPDDAPGPAQPGNHAVPEFDFAAFMGGFRDQMAKLDEQARPVRSLIDAASVRIESEGGEVAVTVTIGGELVGVEFLPAAEDAAPADLAAAITAAYDRARETARAGSPEVLERLLRLQLRMMTEDRDLLDRMRARRGDEPGPGS
ncbi:YbaB/EbfC family nucleoid-associated protein [Glycomyces terrestris]|uniref:YbaB/EbfC family nucleoid-associated protein n=1 Tax=Glycomyces terrestris TaxID=2493553 RepID=UPI0013151F7F|nr:YbaB/EbfC family nucleoid-associated protein [Glycomyces terrestris]